MKTNVINTVIKAAAAFIESYNIVNRQAPQSLYLSRFYNPYVRQTNLKHQHSYIKILSFYLIWFLGFSIIGQHNLAQKEQPAQGCTGCFLLSVPPKKNILIPLSSKKHQQSKCPFSFPYLIKLVRIGRSRSGLPASAAFRCFSIHAMFLPSVRRVCMPSSSRDA